MANSLKSNEVRGDRELSAALDKLFDVVESIELHGDGEHARTVLLLCKATSAMAVVSAEIRARARAAAKAQEAMTAATVMAWLEDQPDTVRRHLLRQIQTTLKGESVLG